MVSTKRRRGYARVPPRDQIKKGNYRYCYDNGKINSGYPVGQICMHSVFCWTMSTICEQGFETDFLGNHEKDLLPLIVPASVSSPASFRPE